MSKIGENGAINCTTMRTAALVGTESPGGLGSTRRQLKFRAGDRSGAGRREESNEISNFSGLGWATRLKSRRRKSHQAPLRGRVVRAAGFRQSRKTRPRQRQLPLNRGDMDDDARAPLQASSAAASDPAAPLEADFGRAPAAIRRHRVRQILQPGTEEPPTT